VRKQRQAAEIPENCLRPAPAGESRRPRSRRRSRFTAWHPLRGVHDSLP